MQLERPTADAVERLEHRPPRRGMLYATRTLVTLNRSVGAVLTFDAIRSRADKNGCAPPQTRSGNATHPKPSRPRGTTMPRKRRRHGFKHGAVHVRFWAHVRKKGECLIWTGARATNGVPVIRAEHRGLNLPARRVAWEMRAGRIPEGKTARPNCGDDRCVRFEHLALGGFERENAGRAKVTVALAAEIHRRRDAGETQAAIARALRLGRRTIWSVVHGQHWTAESSTVARPVDNARGGTK